MMPEDALKRCHFVTAYATPVPRHRRLGPFVRSRYRPAVMDVPGEPGVVDPDELDHSGRAAVVVLPLERLATDPS
jgi:hypothetical protein